MWPASSADLQSVCVPRWPVASASAAAPCTVDTAAVAGARYLGAVIETAAAEAHTGGPTSPPEHFGPRGPSSYPSGGGEV